MSYVDAELLRVAVVSASIGAGCAALVFLTALRWASDRRRPRR